MIQNLLNHMISFNIFSPLIGVFLILFFYLFGSCDKGQDSRLSFCFGRVWPIFIGLFSSLIPLIISLCFFYEIFNVPLVEKFILIKSIRLEYFVEIDGPSILLMCLSSFTIFLCLLIFWQNKNYSSKHTILGVNMLLILQVCCLGVFASRDLLLFYIFFEASLIPMIFIIGIWGREDRVFAALKLFIYTIFGSLFFLFVIVYFKVFFGTTDLEVLKVSLSNIPLLWKKIIWVCLFIAFAIKIPMIPFHTWLPDAHVQAPTFGSVVLASVLIKMGGYAMMRFLIPLFPDVNLFFAPFVLGLSVFAIIYGSFICLAQKDLKKLIAYSSVAHMGYVTLGLFIPCDLGYSGALFQMISHGFISGALFYSVGIIYDKVHTLEISKIHSLAIKMPFFAFLFMIFTLGSVGLPGTSGFVGEFLVILNAINNSKFLIFGVFGALGVIFGAVYMLLLYKKIFFRTDDSSKIIGEDVNSNASLRLSKSENMILLIFGFLIIFYGIQPTKILKKIENIKNSPYKNCQEGRANDANLK